MISRADIIPCATPMDEARRIVEYFAAVKPTEALPTLCVVDDAMFPELVSAFEAQGMTLYNPSRTRLVSSSLGHLVHQLSELRRTRSYDVFSAFIRGGDARRWLKSALVFKKGADPDQELVKALADLDHRQAQFLPETIDDIAPKTTGTLRAIFELVGNVLRKRDLRGFLQTVFKDLYLDEADASAREFITAAEMIEQLLEECFAPHIPSRLQEELFRRRLEESAYSLEADEGDAVVAVGWLEVPFQDADELIIAGFQEGRVPEAVVGHPFLPDRLRRTLGLTDNAARAERDRRILADAVDSRAPGAVKIFFHSLDAKGDVLKPSRLLFENLDDKELIERVTAFYAVRVGTEESRPATLPNRWKLHLPIPPQHRDLLGISPSAIDAYRRCPFTYYLTQIFKDNRLNDRAEELNSSEYGNLAHESLDAWAKGELRDSTDATAIAEELCFKVDQLLGDRFGAKIPIIVAMQGESVKHRLQNFARIQAKWRADGWRIVATEKRLEMNHEHTRFYGKCDRIDHNENTGRWCIIDYKTWDTLPEKNDSLQLPIYCSMLDVLKKGEFAEVNLDNLYSSYCVLGKNAENVAFTPLEAASAMRERENQVWELVRNIERGIFWPPAPEREWQWNFGDWMFNDNPELTVDEEWIKDQLERQ